MFDIFSQAMLFLLDALKNLTGSYGWAIILVTVLLRVVLWPINASQTKSMKQMQTLQPKFKQVQEQYKNDPAKLQQEMMKLYAEHKFNPLAGCLPMLIQLPIFIGLYSALSSPDFLIRAGHENFLFIRQLHNTLHSYAGKPLDNQFAVNDKDDFHTGQTARVYLKNGTVLERKVDDPSHALLISPKPVIPGDNVTFKLPLEKLQLTPADYLSKIDYVQVPIIDQTSRELENPKLTPQSESVGIQMPTTLGKDRWHYDVLVLIIVYGLLTVGYQQLMQRSGAQAAVSGQQGQMMNMMTVFFVGILFFIPIPAGVLLYLVVTMLLMMIQTFITNRDHGKTALSNAGAVTGMMTNKGATVVDIKSS